jgi:hypothetical protein
MNPLIRSQGNSLNVTVYRLVSYTIVAAMMGCAAYTSVNLIVHIRPNWQPWYVVVLCLLVALDRLYTYRRFRDWMFMSREWLARFGSELVVILVLTRLVVGLSHGWQALLAELPLWRNDFVQYFFSGEFWVVLVLVLSAWGISGSFAALLDDIGLDEDLPLEVVVAMPERRPARERLMSLFFSVGAGLVLFTALARVDLRTSQAVVERVDLAFENLPALAAGGAGTLLYFMLGLGLLSQTQFIALHVRWDTRRIPISARLAGRWALYSLLFLLFLALIASLLPTGYSLGPLQVLNYVLSVIVYVLLFIGQTILQMVLMIIDFLYTPFKSKNTVATPTPVTPATQPSLPALPVMHGAPSPVWEVLQSLVFWSVFLGIVIFSIQQYLRQHQDALATLRKIPGWHVLEQLLAWLGQIFQSTGQGLQHAVQAVQQRLRARQAGALDLLGRGFMSLRGLDPRQRVAFFYLAMLRRGAETGLPRSQSQTPAEYAVTLESALPEIDADIASLTEAFVEARYTPHPVPPEKASLVKSTWERIRRALREAGRR